MSSPKTEWVPSPSRPSLKVCSRGSISTGTRDVQRATARPTFNAAVLTEETLARVRGLNAIAKGRGQTLAQMALMWVLRDPHIASTLVGTSSVSQLAENLAALEHPDFSAEELATIDRYAVDSGIDLWRSSSDL